MHDSLVEEWEGVYERLNLGFVEHGGKNVVLHALLEENSHSLPSIRKTISELRID